MANEESVMRFYFSDGGFWRFGTSNVVLRDGNTGGFCYCLREDALHVGIAYLTKYKNSFIDSKLKIFQMFEVY